MGYEKEKGMISFSFHIWWKAKAFRTSDLNKITSSLSTFKILPFVATHRHSVPCKEKVNQISTMPTVDLNRPIWLHFHMGQAQLHPLLPYST
jgi:hypothetical protein